MSTMGNSLDKVRIATNKAFDKAKSLAGGSDDAELTAYLKLKTQDFDVLTKQFGVNTVTDYINAMGFRKKRV